jgi:thiol-disulfide isomerase/thioredoxin
VAFGLIAAACSGGGGSDAAAPEPAAPIGTAATLPFIAIEAFDGGPAVTLNDFVGKPLVVNFWAAWCPSCVAEMSAAFKPAQEQLGDSVTFIGVNIQDDRDKAVRLLAETGVQWISVENQDGSLWTELGGLAMPFTVFISAEGEIVDKHNGPLNESLLLERIEEKLLG